MAVTSEHPALDLRDEPEVGEDVPRNLRPRGVDEMGSAVGSLAGSFGLTWILYYQVLPWSGILGFVICWFALFLGMYASVSAVAHPWPTVVDRLMAAICTGAALVVGFALVTVVVYTVWRGRLALPHGNFYVHSASRLASKSPLTTTGITMAIVGSAIQLGIALVISLPLGFGTAVYMAEVGGWFTRIVRTVVEAMTAVPDLLAGLFVYVTLILGFHMQKDGLAVGIALAVTMTPIIARSALIQLTVVPGGLREASLALGSSHWSTVRRVVLPTARPGLVGALILAAARGIGESAPLLIVSGTSGYFNTNPTKDPMNSLPLYIYTEARSGAPLLIDRAFGAAVVLLVIVLVLFTVARLLARQKVTTR